MNRLKIVIQSTAGYVNELWGKGTPCEGMRRMAGLAHKYGLPVTWSVNAMSAKEMQEELTAWHDEFGDDICLWLKPGELGPMPEEKRRYTKFGLPISSSKELYQWGSYDQIRKAIEKELAGVEEALSWAAPVRIAANMDRSTTLIKVLEDLHFDGLWGYLWQHRDTDGLTDAGCPFNLFYTSNKSFKCPADYPAKIVGAHWFSYDMTNTFHSRATSVFTNDPNDVLRAGICDGRKIDYWKQYFEIWVRNARWNDFLYYMFHQEAHEMAYSDACREYTPEQIDNTALMMDEFFKFLANQDVKVVTLPQLIKSYKTQINDTIPTYFVSDQIKIDKPINYYDFDFFNRPKPPQDVEWPESFFYYDKECQMAFARPHATPVMLYDYTKQHETNQDSPYPEEALPEVTVNLKKTDNQTHVQIHIYSPQAIPYGVAIWDDQSQFHLKKPFPTGSKILGDSLCFFRFKLKQGENHFEFWLEKKLY